MLKTIRLFDKLAFSKNNSNELAFIKNNSNNKIDKFSVGDNNLEHTKKSRKLKSQKLFKFQKLKSEKLVKFKKLSNNKNLFKFNAKKVDQVF